MMNTSDMREYSLEKFDDANGNQKMRFLDRYSEGSFRRKSYEL